MAGRFAPRPTLPDGVGGTAVPVRGGQEVVVAPDAPSAPGACDASVPSAESRASGPVPRPAVAPGRVRTWAPDGPLDLGLVLGPLRRGAGDPTFRAAPDGSVWRASRTPLGPGTLRISASGGQVRGQAWGPGAEWLLEQLPHLLGAADDPSAFAPRHRLLALVRHRRPGLRLTRTGLVLESLIPSILEQKVTTAEAYGAWRVLVRTYGDPAPGPTPGRMYVMPAPRTWALIPSWEWHLANVDTKRASTILRAVRVAARLEEAVRMEPAAARERLELVSGIGPWTSAETVQRSHGAADAVTVGDLHLPGIVGWALAGDRSADDEAMLRLLEPYAGQRHRAARLILLSGRVPPRRAPRMPKGDITGL